MKKYVFCHVCARPVKLTKDGRYRRHGYKMSFATRNYYGVPMHSGYDGIVIKRPCMESGKKVPEFMLKNINHV